MSKMKIILNTTDGSSISVDVLPEETYRMLKERILLESGIELELSQISFGGKQVDEDQSVYDSFIAAEAANKPQEESHRVCIVEGCPSSSLSDPKKEIFNFPSETDRYSTWLLACNRHDLLGRIPVSLNLECGVCADHFSDSCFLSGSLKKRLRKNAVPSLEEHHNNYSILARDMMMPNVKLEDDISLNDCNEINNTERCNSPTTENSMPITSDAANLRGEESVKKGSAVPEDTSNQDEVDEEDLQEDELEELEGDEEEDAETEEDDVLRCNSPLEHPGLICRLCAQLVDTAHFIFSEKGREEKLFDKINTSLPVNIHCNDHLPKQICSQCLSSLNVCYNFAVSCMKAEGMLQEMGSRFRCLKDPEIETDRPPVQNGELGSKGPQRNNLSEESCYDCPLCREGHMETQENVNIDEIEGRDPNDEDVVVQDFLADSVLWEEGEDLLVPDQQYLPSEDDFAESDDGEESYPCFLCGSNFISLTHLFEHSESHQDTDYFPCGHCGLVFNSKDPLSVHLDLEMSSTVEEQYKCGVCGRLFLTEDRAQFHHDQVHGLLSSLSCSDCGQVFGRETNLWDHLQIEHRGQKPFSCPKCEKVFQVRGQLRSHMKIHGRKGSFECEVCTENFSDMESLKSHEATHADMKLFQCEQCGRCFSRKYLLTAHARSHVDKKPRVYTCRVCGEDGFDSLPKLLVHRRSMHQDVMLPLGSKKDKTHKCEQCNKAFTGRVALKHHVMSHAGELPHVCEFCNKGFTQKRSLLLHRRIHTGEKPYQCGDCGKRFVQSAHLYSHLRLHTGEKPYPCSECGATFRLKDVRDSHQRKHTGERPFKCKVCDKSFRTSHSYYQHTWIHTGRKPYPCSYCGKAFRRSNGLKVHIRIHTGEKPHKCDICGRGFAQKQDMKKHKNLHTMGRL